jgi:hypothetical protein
MEGDKIAVLDFRDVATASDTQSAIAMEQHPAALRSCHVGDAGAYPQ